MVEVTIAAAMANPAVTKPLVIALAVALAILIASETGAGGVAGVAGVLGEDGFGVGLSLSTNHVPSFLAADTVSVAGFGVGVESELVFCLLAISERISRVVLPVNCSIGISCDNAS
jgi:hypothetical protein